MKAIFLLLLLPLLAFGQPLIRNDFTTNNNPAAKALVTNSVNAVLVQVTNIVNGALVNSNAQWIASQNGSGGGIVLTSIAPASVALRITNGNAIIGMKNVSSTPRSALYIGGGLTNARSLTIEDSAGNQSIIAGTNGDILANSFRLGVGTTSGRALITDASGFVTNGVDASILSNTPPLIASGSNGGFTLGSGNGTFVAYDVAATTNFSFGPANNTNAFTIGAGGNVGIGTATPDKKFTVAGDFGVTNSNGSNYSQNLISAAYDSELGQWNPGSLTLQANGEGSAGLNPQWLWGYNWGPTGAINTNAGALGFTTETRWKQTASQRAFEHYLSYVGPGLKATNSDRFYFFYVDHTNYAPSVDYNLNTINFNAFGVGASGKGSPYATWQNGSYTHLGAITIKKYLDGASQGAITLDQGSRILTYDSASTLVGQFMATTTNQIWHSQANSSARPIVITANGTTQPHIFVQTNGMVTFPANNVGIGTTTPLEKLEVAGIAKAKGFRGGQTNAAMTAGSFTNATLDQTIFFPNGSARTNFLSSALATNGTRITIKDWLKTASGTNIQVTATTGTVEGSTYPTIGYVINSDSAAVTFEYNGTNWFGVSKF